MEDNTLVQSGASGSPGGGMTCGRKSRRTPGYDGVSFAPLGLPGFLAPRSHGSRRGLRSFGPPGLSVPRI
jgi:hypothetical protein